MTDREELLSAAFDGEAVDLSALQSALADPAGREALASFVLLRAAVRSDEDRPGDGFYEAAAPALRTRPVLWLFRGPRIPATIAASLLALVTAVAFWVGTSLRERVTDPPRVVSVGNPQSPVFPASGPARPEQGGDRQEENRVGASGPTKLAPLVTIDDRQPPKPTRVVRFERGDWREGS